MVKGHFSSFVAKLSSSVDEHFDDIHLFNELKEECITLLEDFVSTKHSGYDTLRMLKHFNIEVNYIVNQITLRRKIEDHQSLSALIFISKILECEIEILKEMIHK